MVKKNEATILTIAPPRSEHRQRLHRCVEDCLDYITQIEKMEKMTAQPNKVACGLLLELAHITMNLWHIVSEESRL